MMKNEPPFKGLNTRIPMIIPIKGRGFINQGSTLVWGWESLKPLTGQAPEVVSLCQCPEQAPGCLGGSVSLDFCGPMSGKKYPKGPGISIVYDSEFGVWVLGSSTHYTYVSCAQMDFLC